MSTVKTRGLRIVTYNIHKGFSQFNRYMMLRELREQLRLLDADIMFLQEVQGEHSLHAARFDNWPAAPQHDFLAADVWQATAYACNVVYDHGHHGNAILSRFPIGNSFNQDVTHLRFERRGLLHCRIDVPEWQTSVHCVCVHLSLFARSRRRQMDALATYLEGVAGTDSPLIIAGDFNDWGKRLTRFMDQAGLLCEHGLPAYRTYPSTLPLTQLDFIYYRGLQMLRQFVPQKTTLESSTGIRSWARLSDHLPLVADFVLE